MIRQVIRFACFFSMFALLSACGTSSNAPAHQAKASASHTAPTAPKNAKNELDWAGTYQSVFPCKGCDGIAVMITLKPDNGYLMRVRHLGKENIDKKHTGRFSWKNNQRIQLEGSAPFKQFSVHRAFIVYEIDNQPYQPAYKLEKTH